MSGAKDQLVGDAEAIPILAEGQRIAHRVIMEHSNEKNRNEQTVLVTFLFFQHAKECCEENLKECSSKTKSSRKREPSQESFKQYINLLEDDRVRFLIESYFPNVDCLEYDWKPKILKKFKAAGALRTLVSAPMSTVLKKACFELNLKSTSMQDRMERTVLFVPHYRDGKSGTPYRLVTGNKMDYASKAIVDNLVNDENIKEIKTFRANFEIQEPQVKICGILELIRTVEHCQSLLELLNEMRMFFEKTVYPHREIRVGFAEKVIDGERTYLENRILVPKKATHNRFSYPQTLAAWALLEGEILAFPADWDRPCNFECLRRLNKLEKVRELLINTDPTADKILGKYLDPAIIKARTLDETLRIREIYQPWVSRQPKPHYAQFISVPVPIIDVISNHLEPPEERGVFNIDTPDDDPPLLTDETRALLELASRLTNMGYELLAKRAQERH